MSVLNPTLLADALAGARGAADGDGARRRHRRDGRDQHGSSPAECRDQPSAGFRSCARGRTTSPQRLLADAIAHRRRRHLRRDRNRAAGHVVPALGQAARTVGSPQIRHAATIGGNVATCSPAGDGLPVLAALDAEVHLVSADRHRARCRSRVHDRAEAHGAAAGRADRGRHRARARRLAGLRQGRRAQRDGDRHRRRVPGRRRRRRRAARARLGRPDDHAVPRGRGVRRAESSTTTARSVADADVVEFGRLAAEAARPIDDHRSTAAYRRHAVAVLARRLLRRAFPNG